MFLLIILTTAIFIYAIRTLLCFVVPIHTYQ